MSSLANLAAKFRATLLPQQYSDNAEPFRIERFSTNGLTGPTVPISGVGVIAFLAMEVGVNPRTLYAFVLLGGFVRFLPIALGVPPQSAERVPKPGWRFGRG
jgi:hypothetical protein